MTMDPESHQAHFSPPPLPEWYAAGAREAKTLNRCQSTLTTQQLEDSASLLSETSDTTAETLEYTPEKVHPPPDAQVVGADEVAATSEEYEVPDVSKTLKKSPVDVHQLLAHTPNLPTFGELKNQNAQHKDHKTKEPATKDHHDSEPSEPDMDKELTDQRHSAQTAASVALDEIMVGTRVMEGHENFVTAYNMLTGIRVAVSRTCAKIPRELTKGDFAATTVLEFDMSGRSYTPSSKYMFQFKDYAPWVFRSLREHFGIDPADYLMSLTSKYIVSELGSPGKSGSFFYYSRDYRYIIKTIRHSEHKQLRYILSSYYAHIRHNPNTLISQFYGLHRVKLPLGRKIYFVVMNNLFPALYEIHRRYDLKGSTQGRTTQLSQEKKPPPLVVYKDLDWLRDHERIVVGPFKRKELIEQLQRDVEMLKEANVMDYSLLIGIHDMKLGNKALSTLRLKEFGPDEVDENSAGSNYGNVGKREAREFGKLQDLLVKSSLKELQGIDLSDDFRAQFKFYRDRGGYQSTNDTNENNDVIYYMGIIDFLTAYTLKKRIETVFKGLVHRRKELSALPAVEYGGRFFRFICMSIGSKISSS